MKAAGAIVALAVGGYLGYKKWLVSPQSGEYLKINLPPIKIPKLAGISGEGILAQLIPEVKSTYIPPGLKLVWPAKISLGALQIEAPVEATTYKLPAKYNKQTVDAVRLILEQKLYQTKVTSTDGSWVIDFPEIAIPL